MKTKINIKVQSPQKNLRSSLEIGEVQWLIHTMQHCSMKQVLSRRYLQDCLGDTVTDFMDPITLFVCCKIHHATIRLVLQVDLTFRQVAYMLRSTMMRSTQNYVSEIRRTSSLKNKCTLSLNRNLFTIVTLNRYQTTYSKDKKHQSIYDI